MQDNRRSPNSFVNDEAGWLKFVQTHPMDDNDIAFMYNLSFLSKTDLSAFPCDDYRAFPGKFYDDDFGRVMMTNEEFYKRSVTDFDWQVPDMEQLQGSFQRICDEIARLDAYLKEAEDLFSHRYRYNIGKLTMYWIGHVLSEQDYIIIEKAKNVMAQMYSSILPYRLLTFKHKYGQYMNVKSKIDDQNMVRAYLSCDGSEEWKIMQNVLLPADGAKPDERQEHDMVVVNKHGVFSLKIVNNENDSAIAKGRAQTENLSKFLSKEMTSEFNGLQFEKITHGILVVANEGMSIEINSEYPVMKASRLCGYLVNTYDASLQDSQIYRIVQKVRESILPSEKVPFVKYRMKELDKDIFRQIHRLYQYVQKKESNQERV